MTTFVSLVNWTDQGIKNFRESAKRADAFAELVQKNGGSVKAIYWTLGEYDIVAIVEAPDAESGTAVLLQVGALGNVRTTTLEAFDREAFDRDFRREAGSLPGRGAPREGGDLLGTRIRSGGRIEGRTRPRNRTAATE